MRGTNRKAVAVVAALLWLLGVEVLPNLHLGTHADDHTHAADGTIVSHAEAHHEHEHIADHHAEPNHLGKLVRHREPKQRDQHAIENVSHAASGIAHHAVALHQPPPPLLAPLAVPHATAWVHAAPTELVASNANARPNARGPPATI
jgi:hypothetical protein